LDEKHLRIILGSESDIKNANIVLTIWQIFGINSAVSIGSCHWHSGDDFNEFVKSIPEDIIVFLGGMSLHAPAIIKSILFNANIFTLVVGVPTDKSARDAIEVLPEGAGILTTGLNTISLTHSLKNAAYSIAPLIAKLNPDSGIWQKILEHNKLKRCVEKRLQPNIQLINSLIPIPKKTK